jgi:hypothetical protein
MKIGKNKSLIRELERLDKNKVNAENLLSNAMQRIFPEGNEIEFFLKYGQKNPSRGVIIFAEKGRYAGYLRVRMESAKNKIHSVHFTGIINN